MGTLLAAAQRIRLSESPMRTAGGMVLNKCLQVSKSLPMLTASAARKNHPSHKDGKVLKHQTEIDALSELFNNHTSKLMDSAGAKYRPKPYPGQITLFHTGSMNHSYGWQRIAKGQFVAIQLPTTTDDDMPHLILQPMVEDLARELQQIVLGN